MFVKPQQPGQTSPSANKEQAQGSGGCQLILDMIRPEMGVRCQPLLLKYHLNTQFSRQK
jgi:hypothetical protein